MPNKKKRAHTDTTVPYIPVDPQDLLAAVLRTPPPPDEETLVRDSKRRQREDAEHIAASKAKVAQSQQAVRASREQLRTAPKRAGSRRKARRNRKD